jgi:hypothetical protein
MAQNVGYSPKDKKVDEAAEMPFLRSVAGYRLIDHGRNEDVREELQITDINSIIKDYQIKWLQHLERMEQNRIPKLLLNFKPRGRRDRGRPCRRWREQFKKFIEFNFKQLL